MFRFHDDVEPQLDPEGIESRVLCPGGGMTLVESTFPKKARARAHRHAREQLGFVRAGRFEVHIGTDSRVLEQGDSYCVPPGERHYAVALDEGSVLLDCLSSPR